jgi:tetratricopeptide (TPR) repeat protein
VVQHAEQRSAPAEESSLAQSWPPVAEVPEDDIEGAGDLVFIMPEDEPAPPAPEVGRRSTMFAAQSVEILRACVEGEPDDMCLRRELGEAMLEAGDRLGGIQELETAMAGADRAGDLDLAASLAAELARLEPETIRHHQKRVEFAFRANDRPRLVDAYICLAEALLRAELPEKAASAYQRVLDIAPDDPRARAAIEALTPTTPEPPSVAPPRVSRPVAAPLAAPPRVSRPIRPGTQTAAQPQPAPTRQATPPSPPVRQSMQQQVATRIPAPTPPRPQVPEVPKAAPRPDDDFVNLGDWLRDSEAPRDTRMVVEEKEPTGDENADFADMLRKFKQGVDENVDPEDYQSHYDLGIAYKEMGLLDEAIHEFQRALAGTQNRVATYEALGDCFLSKHQFTLASSILSRALNERGTTEDQLVGVLYLLGRAAEAQGRTDEALAYYHRVFLQDIEFQDIAARVSELERVSL